MKFCRLYLSFQLQLCYRLPFAQWRSVVRKHHAFSNVEPRFLKAKEHHLCSSSPLTFSSADSVGASCFEALGKIYYNICLIIRSKNETAIMSNHRLTCLILEYYCIGTVERLHHTSYIILFSYSSSYFRVSLSLSLEREREKELVHSPLQ